MCMSLSRIAEEIINKYNLRLKPSSFRSHVEVKCCAAKLALIVQVHANLVQVGDFLLDLFHHHVGGTHRRCVLMSSGCDRKSNFEIYGWSYQ
jgi:hypothetical protein